MLTRLEFELIGGALLLALLLGGLAWFGGHERVIGAQSVQVKWDAAVEADQVAKAIEVARINTAQKASDHETEKFSALAAVGAAHAGDAADRLQHRFAALGPCVMPGAASAATLGASTPGGPGRDVRADVLGVVVQAARRLAAKRDAARGAGLAAEGHYDALTP